MKVYTLEVCNDKYPYIHQGELTKADIKSSDILSEWLNEHIVNKNLDFGNDYLYDYNQEYEEVFTYVEDSLIAKFKNLLDGKINKIYIYGYLGEYKIFTHIDEVDQEAD